MAALQLSCGIDLREAMLAGPERRTELLTRLRRAIERERLKGLRRHWSYDLNRHIALKQALDRLTPSVGSQTAARCSETDSAQLPKDRRQGQK